MTQRIKYRKCCGKKIGSKMRGKVMPVRILIGAENFHELRSSGCYYVDKTELIYDLVHDNTSKVTLFTRPRRFGKTLTMSMIESFFDSFHFSKGIVFNISIDE
jgi:hypothetical protein